MNKALKGTMQILFVNMASIEFVIGNPNVK